jgi:hypothetical protein
MGMREVEVWTGGTLEILHLTVIKQVMTLARWKLNCSLLTRLYDNSLLINSHASSAHADSHESVQDLRQS